MFRNRDVLIAALAVPLAACARADFPPSPQLVEPIAPAPRAVALAPWRPVDAATGGITDLAGLTALAASFPESASVRRRLLSAALRDGNAEAARAALAGLEAMGYGLQPGAFTALAPLIGEVDAGAARARAARLTERSGVSTSFLTIPADHRLVEGVAWDQRHNRLFVSSVVNRSLVRMDDNKGIEIGGLDGGSLAGLVIDEPRRLLWVASGVLEQTPSPDTAFRGLIAVDLDKLMPVRRIPAPDGVSLSDIGIGPDGTIYASDPTGGGVYRLRGGEGQIEALVAPGTLRSPQGLAVHANGRFLYVSDYAYGIAVVDLTNGAVGRLTATVPMMLDGTDGLYWFDEGLVAIQNGVSPMRIVRINLDPAGTVAAGLEVIEANHPEWGEPTNGQINVGDGALIYVSDPQWDRFGPAGAIKGTAPLRPNRIRITPLRDDLTPPPRP